MRWSVERAIEWSRKTGWLTGFNYVTSTAVNSTEMWQSETYDRESIKRELALAVNTGFNSCRVFLPYIVWEAERGRFLENLSDFCDIAKTSGLSVMSVLFDDCAFAGKEPYLGTQDAPKPGVLNGGWTPSPGASAADDPAKEQDLDEYVKTVVGAFRTDDRIVMWDVYNEPGNNGRREKSLPFLVKAFRWAREAGPSQPLTAGLWEQKSWNNGETIIFRDYNYCFV